MTAAAADRKYRLCALLSCGIFLVLLGSRRWQQMVLPQVWAEDGTQILHGLITHGWATFVEPVGGYLITVPKIIAAISLGLSFTCYPLISTILSWLCIALCGLAVVLAPTRLQRRWLCAAAIFVIPSDPEVFGVPLYTFWWASLPLLLLALWDERRPALAWRLAFLLLGGLSSPVILLVLPVLYGRAYWLRSRRSELVLALVATGIAAVQVFFLLHVAAGHMPPVASLLAHTVPKFFGRFVLGNWINRSAWLWSAGVGLLGIMVAWLVRNRCNIGAWVLLFLLLGTITLAVVRVDPAGLHPRLAGPRYFFFPFILTFWMLIQYLHTARSAWIRGMIGTIVVAAVVNAAPVWSRHHDDLHWAAHVRSCRFFTDYTIPIHTDGHRASVWSLRLAGRDCDNLLRRDILRQREHQDGRPTFAYSASAVQQFHEQNSSARLVSSTMRGSDYQKSIIQGYRVIGSFQDSDADTGEVIVQLRRGARLYYRSGPGNGGQSVRIIGHENEFIAILPTAIHWMALDFSNTRLPDEFHVRISDDGTSYGEWSAVAIKE